MPEFTKIRNEVNVDLLKLTVGRIVLSSSIVSEIKKFDKNE